MKLATLAPKFGRDMGSQNISKEFMKQSNQEKSLSLSPLQLFELQRPLRPQHATHVLGLLGEASN